MKLETFYEKFDQFAEAPDAVAKMRELVLQLAVQGKLVEQKPVEGDADALLKAIAAARKKNSRGKPNEETEREDLEEVEGWHQVPASWRWVRLRSLGDIVGGGTPRSDNSAYFADEGIPWLTPADLNGFKAKRILRGRRCITKAGLEDSSARLLPAGSVLFSSRAPIGYVAIAGTELATNQGFKSCVPFISETNEFLYFYLMSAAARIDREASGTTFREVSGKIVNQIPVPLPPLAEQKRIVAKVDELMALCDRLAAQQQERETRHAALARASLSRFADAPTPADLELLFHYSFDIAPGDLRKSILTLAVQGKLVPQNPNDEPAEASFPGLKPLDPDSSDRADIPNQWDLCAYRSLTSLVTSGSRGWKEFYSEFGAIFVRTQNIKFDRLVLDDVAFVELPKSAEGMRTQVLKDDILITITGANVTKAARIEVPIPEAYVSQHIALTRPRWRDMSQWLHLCFISHGSARGVLEQLAYGDKPGLNLNNIRNLVLPIPPLAEQRRIVAKVDQLMALVDQLQTQLAASRATAEKLMEAVVAELTT